MGLRYYANAPATELTASVTNSSITLAVLSATGLPVSYPYTLIIDRGEVTEEIVEVIGAAGTTLTVDRAADDSTAFAHDAGATVEHGISARDIREANSHVNSGSGVHGLTGDVVGDSDAQALSNKDLTDPTNTFPDTVVATTGAQTLEDKTLTAPSISDPTFTGTPVGIPPTGSVIAFAGSSAPAGWLLANGQAVSRTTYADLFAVVGEDHGAGDGVNTFNLPDLRDRAPVGVSATKQLADKAGVDSVTLSTNELPVHTHTINHDHPAVGTSTDSHFHTLGFEHAANTTAGGSTERVTDINGQTGGTGTNATASTNTDSHNHTVDIPFYSGSSGSAGGGGSFSVQNPYVALNYIIKF